MKGNLLNIRYAFSHNKEKTHSFLVERVCFLHYHLLIYPTKYSMGEKKPVLTCAPQSKENLSIYQIHLRDSS